jgi:hypothetical protein
MLFFSRGEEWISPARGTANFDNRSSIRTGLSPKREKGEKYVGKTFSG